MINHNQGEQILLCLSTLYCRYMCGPTVYDSAHIGHASSYVRFDIIRRIMGSVFDIDALLVMGITDIDDKIIRRMKEVSCFHGVIQEHCAYSYQSM